MTLRSWRKALQLQGEVIPASYKDPEDLDTTDKFTVVLRADSKCATGALARAISMD
jgi:hypothetical protein